MTDYYVDPTATYNGNGLAPNQAASAGASGAFNVLSAFNAIDGDYGGGTIYLKRGTLSRGILFPGYSTTGATNYNIDAYGTGADPRINVTAIISGAWTAEGSGPTLYYKASAEDRQVVAVMTAGASDTVLTKVALKASLVASSQWFDGVNGRIYVRLPSDSDPATAYSLEWNQSTIVPGVQVAAGSTINNVDVRYSYLNNVVLGGIGSKAYYTTAKHAGNSGIILYGSALADAITGNEIKYCVSDYNVNNAFELWKVDGAVVQYNTGSNNGGHLIENWGQVTNASERYNIGYSNGLSVWITPDAQSAPDTGNSSNIDISHNLFFDCLLGGTRIASGTGHRYYNNTLYGMFGADGSAGVQVTASAAVDIANNITVISKAADPTWIHYAYGFYSDATATVTGDYNLWAYIDLTGGSCAGPTTCPTQMPTMQWAGTDLHPGFPNPQTLAQWKTAASPQFQHDITGDPEILSYAGRNARLKFSSPCKDTGDPDVYATISGVYDLAGVPISWSTGTDIGELSAGAVKTLGDSSDYISLQGATIVVKDPINIGAYEGFVSGGGGLGLSLSLSGGNYPHRRR